MKHVIIIGNKSTPISGEIELEIPKYVERLELVKSLKVGIKNGEIEASEDAMLSVQKAVEIAEKYCNSVKLHTKQGDPIESIEALTYYQEGMAVIMEASGAIVGGIKLGND